MKFHDFVTCYDMSRQFIKDKHVRKAMTYKDLYRDLMGRLGRYDCKYNDVSGAYDQFSSEYWWINEGRPYYNVWPGIVNPLMKVDLSKIDSFDIHIEFVSLLFRFSTEREVLPFDADGQHYSLRSVLLSCHKEQGKTVPGFTAWVDIGEAANDGPIYTYRRFDVELGKSVRCQLDAMKNMHENFHEGIALPEGFLDNVLSLICGCILLTKDRESEIIDPEVLSADFVRWQKTKDEKFVSKACRRGKKGWNIGRDIEVSPHYRNATMAFVYTGKGRTNRVLRPRKGCLVHKDVMQTLPTGFIDKESKDKNGS